MEHKQDRAWLNDEVEIDLIQLVVELLKNIKPIIICAIICGILLGGYKLVSGLHNERKARQAWEAENEEAKAAQEELYNKYGVTSMFTTGEADTEEEYKNAKIREYEQEKEVYDLSIAAYEQQIAHTFELIQRNQEYKEKSVLLNMNPKNFYQRDAVWYVDTHYQISAALTMQNVNPMNSIMTTYSTLMTSAEFYYYVQDNITDTIDGRYIGELISVSCDAGTGMIRMTVLGNSQRMADEIYAAAKAYLEAHTQEIKTAVGDFDITLMQEVEYRAAETADVEGTAEGEVSTDVGSRSTRDRIISAQDNYDNTMRDLQSTLAELQTSLLELKKTENQPKDPGSHFILKDGIKFGVIGGVVGVVLAGIYYVFRFIQKDVALSEDELRRRYGVFVLSSVRRFSDRNVWQRMLSQLSGDAKRVNSVEEAVDLAQANIISFLETAEQKDNKVLLVGKEGQTLAKIESLANTAHPNLLAAGGDIMTDKSAVEMMRDYQNVVLVERKEETSYREIGRELENLMILNKRVVGLIAL